MKRGSKLLAIALTLCLAFTMVPITSFGAEADQTAEPAAAPEEIVVIYTGDINGDADSNIGVAGVAAYANEIKAKNKYVEIVDTGNALSGTLLASISRGEFVVEAMNAAGYKLSVPGAKEFAFGTGTFFTELAAAADYRYLSTNFRSGTTGERLFEPYRIVSYGETDIAYLGITDPAVVTEYEAEFKKADGSYNYYVAGEKDAQELYDEIQAAIDEAKAKGADYVVALGNVKGGGKAFSAKNIIENTTGINAFINGDSSGSSGETVADKNGAAVLLADAGSEIKGIGVMTIVAGESISAQMISSYTKRDIKTKDAVDALKKEYESRLKEVFASTSSRLEVLSSSGDRLVEKGETNLGDLAADAYKAVTGADVAFVSAEELVTNIPAGGITYNDVMRALPAGGKISVAQVSGFDLLDALEMSVRLHPGENKHFLQVAGLTFDVQETVIPSVHVDGIGSFVGVEDDYRVTNVMVNGKELDIMGTYTVAASNKLLNGDTGYTMLTNGPITKLNVTTDSQAVISYIVNNLKGSVGGAYSKSQVRIDSIKLARQSEIDAMVEKQADAKLKEYKEKLEELQKEIEIQEEVIAIKTMTIKASSKFTKTSGKRKIAVSWTASDDISGIKYQVYKSTKKSSGYTKMTTTSKKTYSNTSGLTKGKTYYYKIRAYKYLNGKYYYSDWSNIASRKVSK
ncbi:MAG: 5'-nucleotidase C-terminal domain-containing protein [Firmicutes bacterium]|nr:5'-nucleotidase C-terminal domain-containing protein [Bacillota bacterium]